MARRLAALRAALVAPGRVIALAVLLLLGLLHGYEPGLLEEFRLRGFDLEQRLSPQHYPPLPVGLVVIDEASLTQYGQWPWPRTLVARLIGKIAAGHPRALGVDIIFAEPDRLSPARLVESLPELPKAIADQLALLPSNEEALAAAFRTVPTILGMGVLQVPEESPLPLRATPLREIGGDPKPFLFTYPSLLRSLPALTAAERSRAVLVGEPDRDGAIRRVPMFVVAAGHLLPGLAIETLRVAAGVGAIGIVTAPNGVEGARLGDLSIPTDRRARAFLHFAPGGSVPTISAADLLSGAYDPAQLQGMIVLFGVTGLGLVDVKETPLGLMQGIEVHAQLIEAMLTGGLLKRPDWIVAAEIALLVCAGLVVVYGVPYRTPRIAALVVVGLVAVMLGVGFAAFYYFDLLFDTVYPTFSSIVAFGVMIAASLRAAEAARLRLAAELEHQRELAAHLEGELNAARAIQMGLLPRHFPPFPEHRNLDIHALIEPARMVGGDLYDFIMIDQRRLFFVIADVSGKGVPAALFMAMTKEVLQAATLQHGDHLDRAFGEANAKISRSSSEAFGEGANMMFVTVLGGILDLVSGTLDYVSAGHDSPYLLRAGAPPAHLETAGGPPLGTVDDFPYPVEHFTLTPGDLLLLYTDGVTEAKDPASAFYTVARLERVLLDTPSGNAAAAIAFVRDDVRRFSAEAEQADDITLLAVRWDGPAASPA